MSYLFQDFTVGNVLTAAQLDQIEENILKHEHGVTANCQVLSLYATLSENETITGQWTFANSVGIGTSTTPSKKLEVRVNAANDGIYIRNDLNGGNTVEYYYANDTSGALKGGQIILDPDAELFSFFDASGRGINLKTSNGYVGIGTSPSFLLHVSQSVAGNVVARIRNESITGYGLNIQNGLDTQYALSIENAAGTAQNISLFGNGNAEFFGKVGIGVAVGSYPLTIKTSSDHLSWQNNSGTEVGRLGVQDSGAAGWMALYSSGVAKIIIHGNGQFESAIATGTAPLIVVSTTVCANLNADMVDGLHTTVLEIGDWDMNSTTPGNGTSTKSVSHGLDVTKIRTVSILIRQDGDGNRYNVDYYNGGVEPFMTITSTDVLVSVMAAGNFDSTTFDTESSYNRGWITIQHIP